MAAVEHELERADRDGQQGEAQEIEAARAAMRIVAHQGENAEGAQDADRQVDVEHPAPGELVGQPAAERRAGDRAQHGADAPQSHRLALLLARIGVHHDGLRDRHQGGAETALQGTEQHELVERLRRAAQHRHDGEAHHAARERLAQAEAQGAEAGERRHDGRGHDIRRDDPGDLLLRRRQRSLDRGQRDVGDRAVERVHDGGGHHREGDEVAAPERRPVDGGRHTARAWRWPSRSTGRARGRRCSPDRPASGCSRCRSRRWCSCRP